MKTGDSVQDGSGRTFQVGQLLGRGLWGKTYTAREEPAGTEWVIKVPLGTVEFKEASATGGASVDAEQCARLCREIALEQGRLLAQADSDAFLRPEARFTTDTGMPVLVLPRMAASLQARLVAGCTLEEVLVAVAAIVPQLRAMQADRRVHGMLRPTNLLTDGQGSWLLADPTTPTLLRHLPTLARARGVALDWLPPEARTRHEQPLADPAADTWSLACAIYRVAGTPPEGAPPSMPVDGLDKAQLVALKDDVRNRLQDEPSNVRFHTKVADRLATLLNRALSQETSPSPPYRFPRLDEFQDRVTEVAALVRPRITHVGRVLLDRPPGQSAFTTDEELSFTTSVGCTAGVESHEDIGTGMALFDLATDTRLRDVACSYTVDRHPSGRYRFGFRVAAMRPGSYRVRIAFTIRDSGDEPVTSEGELQVHPAAGYVPPAAAPAPKAIRFAQKDEPETVTEVGQAPAADSGDAPRATPTSGGVAGIRMAGDAVQPVPSSSGETPSPVAATRAPVTPTAAASKAAASDAAASDAAASGLPRPLAPTRAEDRPAPTSTDSAAAVAAGGPRRGPSVSTSPSFSGGPSVSGGRPPVGPSVGGASVGGASVGGASVGGPSVGVPDPAEPEPRYSGAGKWSEMPLPSAFSEDGGRSGHDDGLDADLYDDATEPLDRSQLPGYGIIDRVLELTHGDAYRLFIGVAAALIVVLIIALVLLR